MKVRRTAFRPGVRPAWLVLALAVAGLWGCFQAPAPVPARTATAEELRQRFPLLKVGRTTQREIRARFGDPASEHDGGRVLIYFLWSDEQKCLQLQPDKAGSLMDGTPPTTPEAQLVLVFSAEGVLKGSNLLYRMPDELWPRATKKP